MQIDRKLFRIAAGALVAVCGALATTHSGAQTAPITFDSPGPFPTGLTWDGDYLWVADYQTERIYRVDSKTGRADRSFDTPGHDPEGLAWDGKRLWHVDGGAAYDLGCGRSTIYIYTIDRQSGKATRRFKAPGSGCNAEDLAWGAGHLWYLDGATEASTVGTLTVFKIDPDTGKAVRRFDAPGSHPSGLAWDGGALWVSDYSEGRIYRVDPATGRVIARVDARGASGLAWDGAHLWYGDFASDRIRRVR